MGYSFKYSSKKRSRAGARTTKKKNGGRVAKKGATAGSTKLKAVIAGEVQKRETQVFVNGKSALHNCIRIPITDAIPAQAGVGQGPDVRRRRANKVVVTGVNVRASFSVSDEMRVMMLVYEPHETVRKHLDTVPCSTVPSAAQGDVPESIATALVPYQVLGLVSKHGPLMTRKAGSGIELDSVDNSVFESRVSTHGGKPIGSVVRKKFGGGDLRRTLNWNQGGNPKSVGMGYTAWSTHMMNEYWKLNKEFTYAYESMNDQVFERSAEMFLYVDCPSLEAREISEDTPLVGAVIRNVIVDVYFHDK
ncbi:MAG: hypothetical protein Q9179_007995 [Wetmoreana sp. 5 TL-2023]